MTMTPIRAHYQGTIGGQLRYVPALNRGARGSLLLSGVAVVLAILSLPYLFFTVFGVILAVLILSGYYLVPFAWWSMRRNRWLFDAPIDVEINDQGLEFGTAAGPRKVPWEAIARVREMKDVFAVMLRPGGAYCIPKSALEGGDLSAFRELAADKVPFHEG